MNSIRHKLLDILLFPVRYFEKLTDKRPTLIAGMILVGAIDLFTSADIGMYKKLFIGKSTEDLYFNIFAAILMIVLLGLVDVVFVSIPLFDCFKYIKRKEEAGMASMEEKTTFIPHIASSVKVMKAYIMSHFIIIPFTLIIHFIFLRNLTETSPAWVQNLGLSYVMLVMIWSAAIIARGINSLYRFNPIFRKLTFIIVFSWNFIFGMVFQMQIMYWLFKIFR